MQDTKTAVADQQDQFVWKTQPAAARWVTRTIDSLAARNPSHRKTGPSTARFHRHPPGRLGRPFRAQRRRIRSASSANWPISATCSKATPNDSVWRHPLGMFPPVIVNGGRTGLALRCDCVDAARLRPAAHARPAPADAEQVIGPRGGMYRHVVIDEHVDAELWLVERHGYAGFGMRLELAARNRRGRPPSRSISAPRSAAFPNVEDGFRHASELFAAAADDIGTDWACDLFFAAERDYWQSRNRAGAVQYERQNRARPRLGQPRSSHVPLQPRRVSALDRHARTNGLPMPRAFLRRPRSRLGCAGHRTAATPAS